MGNFFSADWFPLNIIIVLAVGGVAVLIWGLVTNWGKGHPTTPPLKCPPPDDQSLTLACGGVCINKAFFKCINDAPCENAKATTTTCCEYLAQGNNCITCPPHSPVCNSKEGGSQCCATKDCNSADGCCGVGIMRNHTHNCGNECCERACCIGSPGSPSTCCGKLEQCRYPSHSPGSLNSHSPANGKCQIKCGVQWCDEGETACVVNTATLQPKTGICDKEDATTYMACSKATSCEPGISCNYGVCAGDHNIACNKDGCLSTYTKIKNKGCQSEQCRQLPKGTWGTMLYNPLEFDATGGRLSTPGPTSTSYTTYKSNDDDHSPYFCYPAKDTDASTFTRTATCTATQGKQSTESCFQLMSEPGLVKSVWDPTHSICTGYFNAATDSRFNACGETCPLTNAVACCKDENADSKLTGKICFNDLDSYVCGADGAGDKCYWGSYCGFGQDGDGVCNLSLTKPTNNPAIQRQGVANCGSTCPNKPVLINDNDEVYLIFLEESKWYFISNAGANDGKSNGGCKNITADNTPPTIEPANRTKGFYQIYHGDNYRPNQYDCPVTLAFNDGDDYSIQFKGNGEGGNTDPLLAAVSEISSGDTHVRWCRQDGNPNECKHVGWEGSDEWTDFTVFTGPGSQPEDRKTLKYDTQYAAIGVGSGYGSKIGYLQVYLHEGTYKMQLASSIKPTDPTPGVEYASPFKFIRACFADKRNKKSDACGTKSNFT